MSSFWVPESTPPQVTQIAADAVLLELLDGGVIDTTARYLHRLEEDNELLGTYVDALGLELNKLTDDSDWPRRILRLGAASAYFAYRETGYYQTVTTEAFQIGSQLAALEGVPEAYVRSLVSDPLLESLLSTVKDTVIVGNEDAGVTQVLHIGAGCTRHFLQQAIAA